MIIYEIWLIGLALAIDCLTVSIATGIASRRVIWRPMMVMALAFGIFQGGMLYMGNICTSAFSTYIQHFDHWIAFGLLLYLGCRMIREDWHGEEQKEPKLSAFNILVMAVATSIDAFAVGVSMACMEDAELIDMNKATLIVAFCSWALSIVGLAVGIQIGKRISWHIETVGGLVLIAIGLKVLCDEYLM